MIAVGPLKCIWSSPDTPASPRRIKTSPSCLILTTWWPMPFSAPGAPLASPFGAPSVIQKLPSSSKSKPCDQANKPAPIDSTVFPLRSYLWVRWCSEPAYWLALQRSIIHRCSPSESGWTPVTNPIGFSLGSSPQWKTTWLGLSWAKNVEAIKEENNHYFSL